MTARSLVDGVALRAHECRNLRFGQVDPVDGRCLDEPRQSDSFQSPAQRLPTVDAARKIYHDDGQVETVGVAEVPVQCKVNGWDMLQKPCRWIGLVHLSHGPPLVIMGRLE